MRVKRYLAPTIQEAIAQVKAELGRDAVILHSRRVRQKGIFGLFRPMWIEVIAAVDPKEEREAEPVKKRVLPPARPAEGELAAELAEVKQMLRRLQGQDPGEVREGNLGSLTQVLIDQGIEEKIAQGIMAEAVSALPMSLRKDPAAVWEVVMEKLMEMIPTAGSIRVTPGKRSVVTLVGPTGVGKTTTIAKLAAAHRLMRQQKVGLVTVDTYRIAAVEQLKTYAEIIGVPIEVAFTPEDLRDAMGRLADRDLILVDTAGRSQKNQMQVSELKAFMDACEPQEIHLVLSATTKEKDLREISQVYGDVGVDRIIFTKLDETSTLGSLVNVTQATGWPLSYLTAGQRVPEDIEVADAKRVANLICEGVVTHGRSSSRPASYGG